MYGRECIFKSQTFVREILKDLHVLRSSESDNYFFNGYSLSSCVCLYASYKQNYAHKHIITETTNLVSTCVLCVDDA